MTCLYVLVAPADPHDSGEKDACARGGDTGRRVSGRKTVVKRREGREEVHLTMEADNQRRSCAAFGALLLFRRTTRLTALVGFLNARFF